MLILGCLQQQRSGQKQNIVKKPDATSKNYKKISEEISNTQMM
jgi:hypothetical protein